MITLPAAGQAAPFAQRLRRLVFGPPRDFRDPKVFHKISLVAFLAWVGLGSDGLSSSAYGPDECFRALIDQGKLHGLDLTFMAVFLAVAVAFTVVVISLAYSQVIEQFPAGGGGYVVASKLLGPRAGVVSGSALLVDYIFTITVSVASGGDALFSLLPLEWHALKLPFEGLVLGLLVVLNLRGVKESVTALVPVFLAFVVTHIVLIGGSMLANLGAVRELTLHLSSGVGQGVSQLGGWGLFLVFLAAFSRGAGTFTGIEATSNGLQIMRQPVVETGKRTMLYMGLSLAITASGILFCYLLADIRPVAGVTMNGALVESFAGGWQPFGLPLGHAFVILTLASEGALLFVAAQTGFIDGPRVMANMAIDSWLPRRFASLSDRLTTKDGVLLLGVAAALLLVATRGDISILVVMYAVNVFITFSLTTAAMLRQAVRSRLGNPRWLRQASVQLLGFTLCFAILVSMILEKFSEGAWLTMIITGATIALCFVIHAHYASIARRLRGLDDEFADLPSADHHGQEPDPAATTAVLLVGSYGGVGVHSLLSIQHYFPGYFKNVIFVSAAVVDSGVFKGAGEVVRLRANVVASLDRYVALARRLGWNSSHRLAEGIDGAATLTRLCLDVAREYPRVVFFAGKLLWKREGWYQRILHNEMAYQVQRRLQWKGLSMAVLPVRVNDGPAAGALARV